MTSTKIRFTAFIALMFMAVTGAKGQQVRVEQRFSRDTVLIGDRFDMTIDIEKDLAQEILIPDFKDGKITPQIEIAAPMRIDTLMRDGRKMKMRLTFPLTTFDAGEHTMPPFPILSAVANVTDTIATGDSLQIMVKTFEIDTTTMSIADIKQPIDTPLVFAEVRKWVILAGVLLVLIGLGIFLWRRYGHLLRRGGERMQKKILIPAHILALDEIRQLNERKLWQAGNYKQYYSELTDILRLYAERNWGIQAMEMTTPEIMQALKEHRADMIQELLLTADLVKFAKYTPQPDECLDAVRMAEIYVEQTKETAIERAADDSSNPTPTLPDPAEDVSSKQTN